ncbi:MAG TPA: PRC-barrel domain-containing protein [Thermodesulfobacteriota bacterium]|nr:PRC-barrel domain-containing protein [Thermodesulfobacteriota bacterium]
MDKRKKDFYAMNRSSTDGVRTVLCLLWSLCAIAVILISFKTIAYAFDSGSEVRIQEQALIVKNWKGDYIGTSRHVVMDRSTRTIFFVIVSLDPGGNKEIVVPVGMFSVGKEPGVLVLNISKKQLDALPLYHASDLQDTEFFERVYRFFAIAPPWTEEAPKGKNEPLLRF